MKDCWIGAGSTLNPSKFGEQLISDAFNEGFWIKGGQVVSEMNIPRDLDLVSHFAIGCGGHIEVIALLLQF